MDAYFWPAVQPQVLSDVAVLAWSGWWLPANYSVHGASIDTLFLWIFWITMITLILVQGSLVYFLIRYRGRPDRKKAIFTHGHTRLEMIWTIVPAVILAGLAFASKGVWDNYRYAFYAGDEEPARLMVIAEQFQWNVIYPGPSNELGRYLVYPRPTDLTWPSPDGRPVNYAGVPGPAHLPQNQAIDAINRYISEQQAHARLGKDFADPAGADDMYEMPLAAVYVPVNRPVEIHLTSKDVIHSFFLPNFRVKLDAVPGMRGIIYMTATRTSAEREAESRRAYSLDEIEPLVEAGLEFYAIVNEDSPGAEEFYDRRTRLRFWRYGDEAGTIVRDDTPLIPERIDRLRAIGLEEIAAYRPGYFDLVCAELCGLGHSRMQGQLIVLDQEEYRQRFEGGTAETPAVSLMAP